MTDNVFPLSEVSRPVEEGACCSVGAFLLQTKENWREEAQWIPGFIVDGKLRTLNLVIARREEYSWTSLLCWGSEELARSKSLLVSLK